MANANHKSESRSVKGNDQTNNLRRGKILFTYPHFHSVIEFECIYYFDVPDFYPLTYRFDAEPVFILDGQWLEAADFDEHKPLVVEVAKGQITLKSQPDLSPTGQYLKADEVLG